MTKYLGMGALLLSCLVRQSSNAVPIGFLLQPTGNQRDVTWRRMESKQFSLYYEQSAAKYAEVGIRAAERAYPDLSLLLGVALKNDTQTDPTLPAKLISRFEKIPIVLSSRSWGASFANFGTQNLEVQSAIGSNAALFQHELVHRMMYEHIDPNLGPAGRPVMLAAIPTWWIEGLPEYLTESAGRLETAGVIRSMALKNSWLTYDRLNSLYNADGDINTRGYVTSGRFFKFIVERLKNVSLAQLHKDLFTKLITPPFLNGVNAVLTKHLDKDGSDLYLEFKKHEQQFWTSQLNGMPSLQSPQPSLLTSGYPTDAVIADDSVFTSNLAGNGSGSLLWIDDKKATRLPLSVNGSSRFDMHTSEMIDGGFWTTQSEKYGNATSAQEAMYVPFAGHIKELDDAKVKKPVVFQNANRDNRYIVTQIQARADKRAFALVNAQGQTRLLWLNATNRTTEVLKVWNSPIVVKMAAKMEIPSNVKTQIQCVTLLVDSDQELTRLEKVCTNKITTEVLPAGKAYLRDALEVSDNNYRVLAGWGDLQGLFALDKNGLKPIAAFPEWTEGLRFWGKSGDMATWSYKVGHYALVRMKESDLKNRFDTWAKANKSEKSAWPGYKAYVPPFARYANDIRLKTTGAVTKVTSAALAKKPTLSQQPPTNVEADFTDQEATYRNSHWFTYPTVSPPVLGGWTLGLFSVPFQDEMERHRVEIVGAYNFNTQKIGGSIAYINNRIFDQLRFSIFSEERFNGLIYVQPCTFEDGTEARCFSNQGNRFDDYRLSYLRENGGTVQTEFRFKPSTIVLGVRATGSRIEPSSGPLYSGAGAQNAMLARLGADISMLLLRTQFYLEDKNTPGGPWLGWAIQSSLSGEHTSSLGRVTSGNGLSRARVNAQRVAANVSSQWTWGSQSLTWRGLASKRMGAGGLNLGEIYSPYQTYLLGSGQGLNNLNYPLYGSTDGNKLFKYMQGNWSYRNSLSYNFMLLSNLDKQILIAYFDSIQGEFVVNRGGVSKNASPVGFDSVYSASAAARLNIDIKGLQIFPSLAYGRILGEPGWALFSEVSFSQFF